MSDRPTPDELAHDAPGTWTRRAFLARLRDHGYVIAHPDDVPNPEAPEGLFGSTYDEAYECGWNDCRTRIFAEWRET